MRACIATMFIWDNTKWTEFDVQNQVYTLISQVYPLTKFYQVWSKYTLFYPVCDFYLSDNTLFTQKTALAQKGATPTWFPDMRYFPCLCPIFETAWACYSHLLSFCVILCQSSCSSWSSKTFTLLFPNCYACFGIISKISELIQKGCICKLISIWFFLGLNI